MMDNIFELIVVQYYSLIGKFVPPQLKQNSYTGSKHPSYTTEFDTLFAYMHSKLLTLHPCICHIFSIATILDQYNVNST